MRPAAVCLFACLAAGCSWGSTSPDAPAGPPSQEATPVEAADGPGDTPAGTAATETPARPAPSRRGQASSSAVRKTTESDAALAAASAALAATAETRPVQPADAETHLREPVDNMPPLLGAAPALQAAAAPAPSGVARNDRIYSEADPDVTPAVLLSTKEAGPIFQGLPGAVNTMELLIARDGRVERVRLLTPAARMTDMLLLSGAKTWKFAPALKDGQPVRYRTRFSWESIP